MSLRPARGPATAPAGRGLQSRALRDEVMAKVMCDERGEQLVGDEPLADMSRMSYGGFETFVSA